MDNFKFNFLSRGQLESLNLDKFLLTAFKTITCHRVFSSKLIFAIIARMLCGNHLKWVHKKEKRQMDGNLVPRMLEMAFQSFQISKFSGEACPQTPLS